MCIECCAVWWRGFLQEAGRFPSTLQVFLRHTSVELSCFLGEWMFWQHLNALNWGLISKCHSIKECIPFWLPKVGDLNVYLNVSSCPQEISVLIKDVAFLFC